MRPHVAGALVGVGDFLFLPVAEQEGLAAHGGVDVAEGFAVVGFHHQHQLGPAAQGHGGLLGAVGAEVDAALGHDGDGVFVGGVVNQRAYPGRAHFGLAAGLDEGVTEQELADGAATDVAGTDNQDAFVQRIKP